MSSSDWICSGFLNFAHAPLHYLKNLAIAKSVCYLYKTVFYNWNDLKMQDDVLLSNSCSEITHVISNDRDV